MIPAPFDVVTTACDFLHASKPWASSKPQPLVEILVVRWTLFLRERWEIEPRLHLHGPDGQWLNPWTGTWVPIAANQGRATLVGVIARHLAQLPQTQLGALLDAHQLDLLIRPRSAPSAPLAAITPSLTGEGWRPPPAVGGGSEPALPRPMGILNATRNTVQPPASAATASGTIDRSVLGDIAKARAVLNRMLPTLPALPGYRMAVQYEPVQGIGGDFYDLVPIANGRWLIMIGDVAGHGAEAALIVSSMLKALRLLAPGTADLVELLVKLNDTMRSDLQSGHFITLWAGVLDPNAHTLTHVCAGHHPALLVSLRRQATLTQLGVAGTAIGVVSGNQLRQRLTVESTRLEPGDLVVQFTDGMFEVLNANGIEFGRLRTMGSCIANLEHPPDALASRMVKELKKFSGGNLDDDLTLFILGVDA